MTRQPARLADNTINGFDGGWINRGKPISFRVNGRVFSGYSGDTVFTALLANGVTTLGTHLGAPFGLSAQALPAILPSETKEEPQALPMARTPITQDASYRIVQQTPKRGIIRLFDGGHSLGLTLDDASSLRQPWRRQNPSQHGKADLVIIGGGVAGMSAALAAHRRGVDVILIEQKQRLGGHSGLFGAQEGEDNAEDAMRRLSEAVTASNGIRVLTSTEVLALRPGLVRAHRVDTSEASPRGKTINIAAAHIIIATGALERLPLFPGNRLPGVVGTQEAYELATRYGVWQGRAAVLWTSTNPGYHLAIKARETGIAIDRLLDARAVPASRYIEFSRAFGMVQTPDCQIEHVQQDGTALTVHFQSAQVQSVRTNRLLVNAGWQANLALWIMAGGQTRWDNALNRLEAVGELEGVTLAGSVAGYKTRNGCIQSGADALDQYLAKPRKPIRELHIDPIYESPDASIAPPRRSGPLPTYLDINTSLVYRPQPKRSAQILTPALNEIARPLSLNEITAGVCLGWIPSDAAADVAAERTPTLPLEGVEPAANSNSDGGSTAKVPVYLSGRYGQDARVVRLFIPEQRKLSSGALIFRNSDSCEPNKAIGVVLRHSEGGATALLAAKAFHAALPVSIRDSGSVIAAEIDSSLD